MAKAKTMGGDDIDNGFPDWQAVDDAESQEETRRSTAELLQLPIFSLHFGIR